MDGKQIGRGVYGEYIPEKTSNRSLHHYRSSLELRFMKLLDADLQVSSWSYEISVVEFTRDGVRHRTIPDFIVTFDNGKRFVAEVKGIYYLSRHLESGRYDAVRSWAHAHGMAYVLWTERGWLWNDKIEAIINGGVL